MLVRKALRIALWTIAGLVLALATLYLGAYFALASTPGRAALKDVVISQLGRAGVVADIGDVRWGPAPGAIWITGVSVDMPLAEVRDGLVEAAIALPDAAPERVAIHVGRLAVRLPEPGVEPPVVAGTSIGKTPKKRTTLPDVTVRVDELDLTGPGFGAHLRDVELQAAVGATIVGRVSTGTCHVSWQQGRRVLGFDRCGAAGTFDQDAKRVRVDELVVARGERLVLRADAAMHQGTTHVGADIDLDPWEARVVIAWLGLSAEALPLGLVVQGLSLDVDKGIAHGSVAALHAPFFDARPIEGELVDLAIASFRAEPGLLVPQFEVTLSHLEAATLSAFEWTLEGLRVPHASVVRDQKVEADLPATRIDRWVVPAGSIGPIEADLEVTFGLAGGSVSGLFAMPEGTMEARGRLKVSPLTKRSSFVTTAAFADVTGPLAVLVRHDGDDALRDALGEPLSGSLELGVDAARETKWDPFEVELEWDATELQSEDGSVRRSWDGSEWVEADAEEPDGDSDEAPEP